MTKDEFLEKLRQTPRNWSVTEEQDIRCYINGLLCCPLTSLSHEGYTVNEWDEMAVNELGMDFGDATKIVYAADGNDVDDDIQLLRKELLKACGLS
jgi:hypothetical protein